MGFPRRRLSGKSSEHGQKPGKKKKSGGGGGKKKTLPQPVKASAKSRGADDFTADNEGEYDAQYDEWLAGGGVSDEGTQYELRDGRPAAAGEREEGKAAGRTLGAFEAHQKSMMSGTNQRKDSEYTNRWNDYLQTDKLQAMLAGDIPMDSKFLDGAAARYITASEGHKGSEARDFIKMAKWLRYQKAQIPEPSPVEKVREARPDNIPLAATTRALDLITGDGDKATKFLATEPDKMERKGKQIQHDYDIKKPGGGELAMRPVEEEEPETLMDHVKSIASYPGRTLANEALIPLHNEGIKARGRLMEAGGKAGNWLIDRGDDVQEGYDKVTGYQHPGEAPRKDPLSTFESAIDPLGGGNRAESFDKYAKSPASQEDIAGRIRKSDAQAANRENAAASREMVRARREAIAREAAERRARENRDDQPRRGIQGGFEG